MGVVIMGADLTQGHLKDVIPGDVDNEKQNQGLESEEPIKFGLVDCSEETTNGHSKGEGDSVSNGNFPKDAVDEWPVPKQIHIFYFIRYRSYEDPKLKTKIDQVDKEIQKTNQARFQITESLKAKRSERATVISQLRPLTTEDKRYRMIVDEKRKEMEPLHAALGKLRSANNHAREKGVGICSSEEELNELIRSLHFRMQHESNTLAEEKQLLKEIRQLEGTRDKVVANAAMKAKIQDSLGQRDAIQDQVKLIGGDLDGVRKQQTAVRTQIKHLEEELRAIDDEISSLQEQLMALNEKKSKAYETFSELRKQRDEGNTYYYQNRSLLNNAKDLAAKKEIVSLGELSHAEIEKFMSLWSSSKAFRDDYEKRILPSLDSRQLSRDGRMRNPDEKPLLLEVKPSAELEAAAMKVNIKRTKEDVKPPEENNTVLTSKVHKEGSNKLTEAEMKGNVGNSEMKGKVAGVEDTGNLSGSEKVQKESTAANRADEAKLKEIKREDEAKLKEIKREEEIAKAKLASERKKKLAEKTAAKAAVRAQKEAEKKLKEHEKRAKKKAGGSTPAIEADQIEVEMETVDSEKADVMNVEASVSSKNKVQKENVRYRNRPRAQEALPKVIQKRKKSPSYWAWAIPGATVLVLMLVILTYYYVF
ncbi:proton pump-interactor 1-like [Tasmannia lanceolata]|uniref:proton pump-interactor 1-like n=1 Tax=Tasmannia lanceolata TaxID=3420 RepID=UPI004062E655